MCLKVPGQLQAAWSGACSRTAFSNNTPLYPEIGRTGYWSVWCRYLDSCKQLGLAHAVDGADEAPGDGDAVGSGAAASRAAKISRFKLERRARARLDELHGKASFACRSMLCAA